MSNPLRIFRKYQYLFLVAFGIMLIFTFVLGPVLSDYFQSQVGAGGGDNPIVVKWASGELREYELGATRTRHLLTIRFLQNIAVPRAEAKFAEPVTLKGKEIFLIKGRSYRVMSYGRRSAGGLPESYYIQIDGEPVEVDAQAVYVSQPRESVISQIVNEEDLVRRLLLAKKAEETGILISDETIQDYFDALYDVRSSDRPNYEEILQESTNGRLTMQQLMAQMTIELSARRMLIMAGAGLNSPPPQLIFDCFNKLNRRVTAELLPVDVESFTKAIDDPSEQAVRELYDEGKDRFPSPDSADPGFKRRQKISFGYFKGTFDTFLTQEQDRVRPEITDEEIEKYYKDNPSKYLAPVPKKEEAAADESQQEPTKEMPSDGGTKDPTPSTDNPKLPVEKPADTTPETTPPAGKGAPTGKAPAKPSSSEQPAGEGKNEKKLPPEAPVSPPAKSETPQGTEKPAEKSSAPEKLEKADSPENSNTEGGAATTKPGPDGAGEEQALMPNDRISFVSYADPQEGQSEKAATGVPEKPANDVTGAASEAEPKSTDPKSEEKQEEGAVKPETKPANAEGATDGKTEPKKEAEPKTNVPPGDPQEKEQPPAAGGEKQDKPPKEDPKLKPLDDALRDEIRDTLADLRARPEVRKIMEDALRDAQAKVVKYGKDLKRADILKDAPAPDPLDFDAIAKEFGLEYVKTPLLDTMQMNLIRRDSPAEDPDNPDPAYYELARATDMRFENQGVATYTIIDLGYADDPNAGLFAPRRLSQWTPMEATFVFWRMEETSEFVPKLDEIRDEVVKKWKMQQAVELAIAKADELAKQARGQSKPLGEVFPNEAKLVIQTNEFSWMTSGPQLSSVEGTVDGKTVRISGAGDDFMRNVFALAVAEVGTTVDESQTRAYVVRIASENRPESERRDLFLPWGYRWGFPSTGPEGMNPSNLTRDVFALVQNEQANIVRGWIDDLDRELDVTWERPPRQDATAER